jgi:hypothetical protein
MTGRLLRQVLEKFFKSPMAKPLGPLAPKLYEGRQIQDLLTLGHVPVAAVAEGWTKVQEHLVNVT